MTSGIPESTVATSELVVPRSMPTILLTPKCCHEGPSFRTQFSIYNFRGVTALFRMTRLDASKGIDRFEFERALLRAGKRIIAGLDEAGRGPLAGPVVAAAVILPPERME